MVLLRRAGTHSAAARAEMHTLQTLPKCYELLQFSWCLPALQVSSAGMVLFLH